MARETSGGGVDWQFRCCDGGCGRTYQRPAPMCTHMDHMMESNVPAVAAMHLEYAATFDPFVYLRCAPRAGCPRSGHRVFLGARATAPGVRALQRQHSPVAASAAHDATLAGTARWCANRDVYRMMPSTPPRGTAVGVYPAARSSLFPLLDRTLDYADRFPPANDRSYMAQGAVYVFAELHCDPTRPTAPQLCETWWSGE
eukprot:jgi/Tetstr1/421801/TSEL_012704.t1